MDEQTIKIGGKTLKRASESKRKNTRQIMSLIMKIIAFWLNTRSTVIFKVKSIVAGGEKHKNVVKQVIYHPATIPLNTYCK